MTLGAAVALVLPLALSLTGPAAAAPVGATHEAVPAADRPAHLVAAEDARLAAARQLLPRAVAPFRFTSGDTVTLVLSARPGPYGVADLLALAPQTFVEQEPGTYLLREHLLVAPGATLSLSRPGGLVLRLASAQDGFVSVVGLGGHLVLTGTAAAPLTLTSWDMTRKATDTELGNGRAYLRAVGGQLEADHLRASDLGFWSGRTGGLALTGADRSDVTADGDLGKAPDRAAGPPQVIVAPAGPLGPGVVVPLRAAGGGAATGPSRLTATTVDGDAYGLFVSGAHDLRVTDSTVRRSSVSGVVLHRDVTGARIERTTASDGAGDGFRVDRGAGGVVLSRVTATRNTRNGITVVGGPQAEGPSPTGASTRSAPGTTVRDSTVEQNGRYGIEVQGGDDQRVEGNTVSGSGTGVLVSGPAQRTVVTGNTVTGTGRHAVSLVDGVRAGLVDGNTVRRSTDGVYLRDSQARITRNTVEAAARHGLTLVGDVDGSAAGGNTLSGTGRGTAAVDSVRATGRVTWTADTVDGFADTTSARHWLGLLLHPMNVLWMIIALLLAASAVRSRVRRGPGIAHPYAHQMSHQMSHHDLPPLPPLPAGPPPVPFAAPRAGARHAAAPAPAAALPGGEGTNPERVPDRHAAPVAAP